MVAYDFQLLLKHDVYMPLAPIFHVNAWGMPYVTTPDPTNRLTADQMR